MSTRAKNLACDKKQGGVSYIAAAIQLGFNSAISRVSCDGAAKPELIADAV